MVVVKEELTRKVIEQGITHRNGSFFYPDGREMTMKEFMELTIPLEELDRMRRENMISSLINLGFLEGE